MTKDTREELTVLIKIIKKCMKREGVSIVINDNTLCLTDSDDVIEVGTVANEGYRYDKRRSEAVDISY